MPSLKNRNAILKELKNVRKFLDNLESSVKNGNHYATDIAYSYLTALAYHMNKGDLTPESISFNRELRMAWEKDNA